jgi:3-methylfumaryl-CoA hydratase
LSTLTPDIVDAYRASIGQSIVRTQMIDAASRDRFNAAVDADLPSPLVHWAYFQDVVGDDLLGADGHPRRGDFLPDIPQLPRRMFASASIEFHGPLHVGLDAEMTMKIVDLTYKNGRGGDLVFVDVQRVITQRGDAKISERQTLVYRAALDRSATAAISADIAVARHVVSDTAWTPGTANLFRFSAATFNGHRIHYDRRYAVDVEGYPDLVVHGPFIAAKLAQLAARRGPLASFTFRAQAPCFVDCPIQLVELCPGKLEARRDDGTISMTAEAHYQ